LTDTGEEALSVLRTLSAALADALTADETARATLVTVLGMPGVARAGLALNDAGGRELRFVSTDDDALTPARVNWCLIDGFADVPLVDAVRLGEHVYTATADELDATYPAIAARQRELRTRSLAALALATETERVGGLLLCFDTDQPFDSGQRWLFGALAAQVTQALRRGLAHQRRHTTAEQLQRSLMPRSLPDLGGLELGAHYRPGGLNSDVGGDWYDVMALPDGSTAVAVGDVMGKGTGAAIVMSEMRASLRAYALLDPTPSVVLDRIDRLVTASAVPEQLMTLAYGVVSPDCSQMTFAVAGHPPPLLVAPGEAVRVLDEQSGSALGLAAGPWPEATVDLTGGRVLLLYSDGLVASRSRDLSAGIAELVAHLAGLPARRCHPRELCATLGQPVTGSGSDDDVTLLAVAAAAGDVRRARTRLPADTTAPREARRFLTRTLQGWDVEEDALTVAEVCVSELATNAVIHTGTPAELTVRLDASFLTVLVRDGGGAGTVQHRTPGDDPLTVSGRGLDLVEAMSTAWAAEHGADGTTVWFEVERPTGEGGQFG
jgi:serine phosphatase RsbU (regulator of sigma subunit)/anti-sigma regulatory factor (Ser/Thr protein kinase)